MGSDPISYLLKLTRFSQNASDPEKLVWDSTRFAPISRQQVLPWSQQVLRWRPGKKKPPRSEPPGGWSLDPVEGDQQMQGISTGAWWGSKVTWMTSCP